MSQGGWNIDHGIGLLVETGFYALAVMMGEIVLLRTGWTRRTIWGEVGMKGATVADAALVAEPLDFEVRRVSGSGCCHHFHRCCGGRGVFVLVQPDDNNMLHKNPNCKIVQCSTNNMYNRIII